MLKNKEYFDFTFEADILCKSNGVAGLAFRIRDAFNYYAFLIDKMRGIKALVKVQNGKEIIIKSISDGGILLNDWHKVIIKVRTNNIEAKCYDMEQSQSVTEKTLTAQDSTYVKGSVGFLVNKMPGFYFDALNVTPAPCWTPWQPKEDIKIITNNASNINEDFRGTSDMKYKIFDPKEIMDGPSKWEFKNDEKSLMYGLEQKTASYDSSPQKKPAMALNRECQFANGSMRVKFIPNREESTISIIFKYKFTQNANSEKIESFYSFDMTHSTKGGQWTLRKFMNDDVSDLKTVSNNVGLNKISMAALSLSFLA